MVNSSSVKFVGASRTDAGVHALGQVGNFWVPETVSISCSSFFRGLNSLTPDDLIIADVQDVHPDFHARFDACSKIYCYQIYHAMSPSIYHRRFSWHIRRSLAIDAMRQAATYLVGCHDFASFQASSCGAATSIRTLLSIHIQQRKHLIRVFIKANAFLQNMVRILVGTLVEVGMGKRAPEDMERIVQAKDRTSAGVTAPAAGLFLLNVSYQTPRHL